MPFYSRIFEKQIYLRVFVLKLKNYAIFYLSYCHLVQNTVYVFLFLIGVIYSDLLIKSYHRSKVIIALFSLDNVRIGRILL